VELHGGSVSVESRGADTGATFTVRLPLCDVGAVVAAGADSPPEVELADVGASVADDDVGNGADVTTLLVVDDSAELRSYLRAHFAPRYRVLEAEDGATGVAFARQQLPDIVISDVMMPGMDGHQLCRELRASPETDFIPIILLTAKASTEQRIAGLEHGADDYLVKPFAMRELDVRIDNLIASRRLLRDRFAAGRVELRPRAARVSPSDRAFLDRVRTAIGAHLADADFGVAELAREVFQDRSHLFRRIRYLLGETPSDLIRRLRIEHAARLLNEGAGTVAEVACAAGFNSLSHFRHCFQQVHGVTPAAFRDRALPR
jgi:DNA-binding response OmpR family regulator